MRRAWGSALLGAALALAAAAPAQAAEADGVGLFEPDQGRWHLRQVDDPDVTSFFFGNPADVPIFGDWDCDGVATPGLFRPSDAFFYLRNSNTPGVADWRFFAGDPADVPLAGDWNGDGCDTVGLFRPTGNRIFLFDELADDDAGLGAADVEYVFGDFGDKPFAGDFDGNGRDEIGLHRESTGLVYFRLTHTSGVADAEFVFGDPGDRLVAGDWTRDGVDTVAIFRPSAQQLFLRDTNTQGNADLVFPFGDSDWLPIAGPLTPPPPPPLNSPPVAFDDEFTVEDGGTLEAKGLLDNDVDADGDPLTAILEVAPEKGELTLAADGSFTYVHDGSGPGADSFTYRASDGAADSGVASVAIEITEGAAPPSIDEQSFRVSESTPVGVVVGFVQASDPNAGDTLSFAVAGGDGAASFTVDAASGALRVANPALDFDVAPPGPDGPGPFVVEIEVSDGGLTASAPMTVALDPVNDHAPVFVPVVLAVDENSPAGTPVGTLAATDADLPGDGLTFSLPPAGTTGQDAFAVDALGNVTVADPARLDHEAAATLELTVAVTDDGVIPGPLAAEQVLTITVGDVNEAPVLTPTGPALTGTDEDTVSPGDDVAAILGTSVTDPDAGAVAGIAIVGRSGGGTWQFSIDGGSAWAALPAVSDTAALVLAATGDDRVRYVPDGEDGETASLTYRAWDRTDGLASGTAGVDASATGGAGPYSTEVDTASLAVTPVNDPPTLDLDPAGPGTGFAVEYLEGDPPVALSGAGLDVADVDGATLVSATVTLTAAPDGPAELLDAGACPGLTVAGAGTHALSITPVASHADYEACLRTVTYLNTSPDPAPAPDRAVEFSIDDGAGGAAVATATVTVTPVP